MTTVTKPLPRIRNPEKKILRPLTPKDLVPRIGASEAMIRIFLRKYYPDIHEKNKSWIFSPETAREIETDYKSRVQAREAEKKQRIERELAGIDE
ncbi:MAG: hypothetical protein WAU55_02585 [Dehalococcoidales bacterium]